MQLEPMAIQLMAELDRLEPELDKCVRDMPAGAAHGSGRVDDLMAVVRALETAGLLHDHGPLDAKQEAALLDLESAAVTSKPAFTQRTIALEIDPGDGEARIVGVASGSAGSAEDPRVICAQRELGGKVLPIPAARAGRRTTVRLHLRPVGEEHSAALDSAPEPAQSDVAWPR